ncbi:Uncharacterised protein [Yersinia pseudotuberculosis]|uniref:Uncharacterized protein n=1 Tax=Yersinia pseudotuberculosis TaxID=633 RepID=A0A380QDK4_YERPU|nr:Uncharacterised protein [Yersinia pseudotuberculosis]
MWALSHETAPIAYLSFYLSVYLSICLSVYLSVILRLMLNHLQNSPGIGCTGRKNIDRTGTQGTQQR